VAVRSRTFTERRAALQLTSTTRGRAGAALRFLEARARSEAEVRRRLLQAGYREELVDGASRGLSSWASSTTRRRAAWVESRDRARPRGERALRRELSLKGSIAACSTRSGRASGRGRDAGTNVDLEAARGCSRESPLARARRGSADASPAGLRAARPERLRPGRVPRGEPRARCRPRTEPLEAYLASSPGTWTRSDVDWANGHRETRAGPTTGATARTRQRPARAFGQFGGDARYRPR
jgi:hypothetical protein